MSRELPEFPSLEHLKKQAKDLLHAGRATKLVEAQRLVAQDYGFPSWAKLKVHVESFAADRASPSTRRSDRTASRTSRASSNAFQNSNRGSTRRSPATALVHCPSSKRPNIATVRS